MSDREQGHGQVLPHSLLFQASLVQEPLGSNLTNNFFFLDQKLKTAHYC